MQGLRAQNARDSDPDLIIEERGAAAQLATGEEAGLRAQNARDSDPDLIIEERAQLVTGEARLSSKRQIKINLFRSSEDSILSYEETNRPFDAQCHNNGHSCIDYRLIDQSSHCIL